MLNAQGDMMMVGDNIEVYFIGTGCWTKWQELPYKIVKVYPDRDSFLVEYNAHRMEYTNNCVRLAGDKKEYKEGKLSPYWKIVKELKHKTK